MQWLSHDTLLFAFTLISGLTGFSLFIWKRLIKPTQAFLEDQDDIKESIETIRKEVVTNGGLSIKDVVNSLKHTCERIEDRQRVLDQRSQASLHYHDQALFETNMEGHLIWNNDKFQKAIGESLQVMEGYDWVTLIDEPEREAFLKEFSSCLSMSRRLDIETISVTGKSIRFVGYPYKVTENTHLGFLIHLSFN